MKISTLMYSMKQGLRNIHRNSLFSLASIGTIVACLFLFGILLSVVMNFQYIMRSAEKQIGITVFFEEDIDQSNIDAIGKEIESKEEVSSVKYISAEEAWEEFSKEMFGDKKDILAGFGEDNPLEGSSSYEIHLKDISKQKKFVEYLEGIDGVRQVNSSETTASGLSNLNVLAGYASVAVILILLGVAVFLISNTVTIGISVRREEIGIMKLIGATDFFVKAPFVIEGVMIGLIGSIIPIGLLYLVYDRIIDYVVNRFHMLANLLQFLPTMEIIRVMAPISIFVGVGIGFLGSMITIRKHLRV